MGEYKSEWFSFKIKSQRHILDLAISPAFARGVGFQVHEMKNNSFQLFWNYALRPKEFFTLIAEYGRVNKINPKTPITEIFFSDELAAFMRAHAPEIFIADLDKNDMALVNAVVNANWQDEEYRCGLDGHHYDIKIYGEPIREYKCWHEIPKGWSELIPLVERLIEIAKLEPRDCYEVHGVW